MNSVAVQRRQKKANASVDDTTSSLPSGTRPTDAKITNGLFTDNAEHLDSNVNHSSRPGNDPRRNHRPLSWFSLTGSYLTRDHFANSHSSLPHNSSQSSIARSVISNPILQSTSNASIAQAEGVEFRVFEESMARRKRSAKAQKDDEGGDGGRKTVLQSGRKVVGDVKDALRKKFNFASTHGRSLSTSKGFEQLKEDNEALSRKPRNQKPPASYESLLGPSEHTGASYHQPMTIGQSLEDMDQVLEEAASRLSPNIAKDFSSNSKIHPELAFGDLETSFTDAVDKLAFQHSPNSKSAVGTLSPFLAKSQSARSPARIHAGVDDEEQARRRAQTLPGILKKPAHPDGLRSHPDVMSFASPPSSYVPTTTSVSEAASTAHRRTAPRIEITQDDDQMTVADLDDAPIYSESMGNLSQYVANPMQNSFQQGPPRRSAVDIHNLHTNNTPTRIPRPEYGPQYAPTYGSTASSVLTTRGEYRGMRPRPFVPINSRDSQRLRDASSDQGETHGLVARAGNRASSSGATQPRGTMLSKVGGGQGRGLVPHGPYPTYPGSSTSYQHRGSYRLGSSRGEYSQNPRGNTDFSRPWN